MDFTLTVIGSVSDLPVTTPGLVVATGAAAVVAIRIVIVRVRLLAGGTGPGRSGRPCC